METGDLQEALNAAEAIGDDRLQQQSQGRVVPDSFTHGTSQQRYTWFKRGFDSGDPAQCNTFGTRLTAAVTDQLLNLDGADGAAGHSSSLADDAWSLEQALLLRKRLAGDGLWVGPQPAEAPCISPEALKSLRARVPPRLL